MISPDEAESHELNPEGDQQHREQQQRTVGDTLAREPLDQQDQR